MGVAFGTAASHTTLSIATLTAVVCIEGPGARSAVNHKRGTGASKGHDPELCTVARREQYFLQLSPDKVALWMDSGGTVKISFVL